MSWHPTLGPGCRASTWNGEKHLRVLLLGARATLTCVGRLVVYLVALYVHKYSTHRQVARSFLYCGDAKGPGGFYYACTIYIHTHTHTHTHTYIYIALYSDVYIWACPVSFCPCRSRIIPCEMRFGLVETTAAGKNDKK